MRLAVKEVHGVDAGAASGMASTAQRTGNGLGGAIVGSVLFSAQGALEQPSALPGVDEPAAALTPEV